MDRKEIIELAKKNGMVDFIPVGSNALWEQIEKFVTIAVKDEREKCANVCVDLAADYVSAGHPANEISARAVAIGATRIRARGEAQ